MRSENSAKKQLLGSAQRTSEAHCFGAWWSYTHGGSSRRQRRYTKRRITHSLAFTAFVRASENSNMTMGRGWTRRIYVSSSLIDRRSESDSGPSSCSVDRTDAGRKHLSPVQRPHGKVIKSRLIFRTRRESKLNYSWLYLCCAT